MERCVLLEVYYVKASQKCKQKAIQLHGINQNSGVAIIWKFAHSFLPLHYTYIIHCIWCYVLPHSGQKFQWYNFSVICVPPSAFISSTSGGKNKLSEFFTSIPVPINVAVLLWSLSKAWVSYFNSVQLPAPSVVSKQQLTKASDN